MATPTLMRTSQGLVTLANISFSLLLGCLPLVGLYATSMVLKAAMRLGPCTACLGGSAAWLGWRIARAWVGIVKMERCGRFRTEHDPHG